MRGGHGRPEFNRRTSARNGGQTAAIMNEAVIRTLKRSIGGYTSCFRCWYIGCQPKIVIQQQIDGSLHFVEDRC